MTSSTRKQKRMSVKRPQSLRKKGAAAKSGSRRGSALATALGKRRQWQGLTSESFPVVGIGASAGGLEAFTKLLKHLPGDTGMAFVLVQHLDPTHASALTEILSRATAMPVTEVKDGMRVEPDHVYVIPPNTNMAILHRILSLMPRTEKHGLHLPIDYFLHSLAEDRRGRSVGVILSGTASDGTVGLKAIKAEGGITFAQDERSAKYDGMPRSAILSGFVDCILPPEGIARELVRLSRHPYVMLSREAQTREWASGETDILNKVFILLRTHTGVDFTDYKHTTIRRRIQRRMLLHQIDRMEQYVQLLQQHAEEVEALYQDLLINVTSFFRDPDSFRMLRKKMFPRLLKTRGPDQTIRVWVPGCSTGEEAYSIAISLLESIGDKRAEIPVQIFATDISGAAIEKARAGVYPKSIEQDVSAERLRRFFVKSEHGYQIKKAVREMCVFARQNAVKDPPFSKLDLISCRNVMIYLGPPLQKKLLPIFHYALKPDGLLMLGSSETIGGFSNLFVLADKKEKIYTKRPGRFPPMFASAITERPGEQRPRVPQTVRNEAELPVVPSLYKEADSLMLSQYAPPGVLINDDLRIIQFRGITSPFLAPSPGEASLDLLQMVREDLRLDLRSAIHKARKTNARVRTEGVPIDPGDRSRRVTLDVIPFKATPSKERFFLVVFEEAATSGAFGAIPGKPAGRGKGRRIDHSPAAQLRHELAATKEYLRTVLEEHDAGREELRSANEEIQSSNEELQSTNEELETAKEELQSTNEELTTLNEELQTHNSELNQVNNDLINFLGGAHIPIVMVGGDLRIRRFTAAAQAVVNLIPADVGRPLGDIRPNVNVPDLGPLILEVMDTLTACEREVQDRQGHWHSLRIRPYKTADGKIDGAMLTFIDIDTARRSAVLIDEAHDFANAIVETLRDPLVVLNPDLRVKRANGMFYKMFQVTPEDTEGRFLYDLGDGQWNIPKLRQLLEEILPHNSVFNDFVMEHEFPRIGHKRMLLNARRILGKDNELKAILLVFEDATQNGKTTA
jgi:two-component system, chemotaxis family, CheB/CheR fusion protein